MGDFFQTGTFDASINGVGFDFKERQVTGGRDFAARLYSHQEGQDAEDTGRQPRKITFTIELFRDVDEAHYPDLYYALVDACENPEDRGFGELVDPEFGPMQVRILPYQWSTTAERRDGGVMTLAFEELGDDSRVLAPATGPSAGTTDRAVEAAADLDESLTNAGVTEADLAAGFSDAGVPLTDAEIEAGQTNMSGLTDGFVDTVQGPSIPPEELAIATDRLRARVEVARDFATGARGTRATVQAFDASPSLCAPVLVSSALLMATATAMANRALMSTPTTTEIDIVTPVSAIELAVKRLGDPARTQEIIDLNPGINPLRIAAGTRLRMPLR